MLTETLLDEIIENNRYLQCGSNSDQFVLGLMLKATRSLIALSQSIVNDISGQHELLSEYQNDLNNFEKYAKQLGDHELDKKLGRSLELVKSLKNLI